MKQRNQYAKGMVRPERLPIVPVSKAEKAMVERCAELQRVTLAQVMRAGLVTLGVLSEDSLYDLPTQWRIEIVALLEQRGRAPR
jgi:hypothetical protein